MLALQSHGNMTLALASPSHAMSWVTFEGRFRVLFGYVYIEAAAGRDSRPGETLQPSLAHETPRAVGQVVSEVSENRIGCSHRSRIESKLDVSWQPECAAHDTSTDSDCHFSISTCEPLQNNK